MSAVSFLSRVEITLKVGGSAVPFAVLRLYRTDDEVDVEMWALQACHGRDGAREELGAAGDGLGQAQKAVIKAQKDAIKLQQDVIEAQVRATSTPPSCDMDTDAYVDCREGVAGDCGRTAEQLARANQYQRNPVRSTPQIHAAAPGKS